MAFPENIFVPIGVVSAALIAGGIAYAGFISTKESKVSEFRQNWINELREEIATYVSRVDALIEHVTKANTGMSFSLQKRMSVKLDHSELYSEMLKSRISILLRINNKEKAPQDFQRNEAFLNLVESIYQKFEGGKFPDVYSDIESLTGVSRSLLKHEWDRVRDGESRFQGAKDWAKWGMQGATTILMALLMNVAYESFPRESACQMAPGVAASTKQTNVEPSKAEKPSAEKGASLSTMTVPQSNPELPALP
ncbi:hypothetical protein [Pseudomonas marginalis]|uniref:hypothetical protein n=1 Tax=Pseudomonas marginalis TaxID=298 RepID=UPI002A367A99|nr:hypothetical protein [Pseudomonas marginalis]WPN21777.1 hypothetical protein QMK57_20470 [Pseudomonas marginalis]